MVRYNLLRSYESGYKGMIIMATPAYRGLLTKRPGFSHLNVGDFHSYVEPQDLGRRIYENLVRFDRGLTRLNFLERPSADKLDDECAYVIGGRNGARIVKPGECEISCQGCRRVYEKIFLAGVGNLIDFLSGGGFVEKLNLRKEELLEIFKTVEMLKLKMAFVTGFPSSPNKNGSST